MKSPCKSLVASARASALLSDMTTFAPCCKNSLALASPIPLLAPVITATCLLIYSLFFVLFETIVPKMVKKILI
jgi:hypothetical protein